MYIFLRQQIEFAVAFGKHSIKTKIPKNLILSAKLHLFSVIFLKNVIVSWTKRIEFFYDLTLGNGYPLAHFCENNYDG